MGVPVLFVAIGGGVVVLLLLLMCCCRRGNRNVRSAPPAEVAMGSRPLDRPRDFDRHVVEPNRVRLERKDSSREDALGSAILDALDNGNGHAAANGGDDRVRRSGNLIDI